MTASRLSSEHLEQLRGSGLTEETIKQAGLYTERDRAVVHRHLNWPPLKRWTKPTLGDCLILPVYEPGAEEPYAYRARPDQPRIEKRGDKEHAHKYESPHGAGVLVYYPPRTRTGTRLASESTLLWTEGEKKALLLDQLGYACIGLTGVWNAHDPKVHNPPGRPAKSGPFVLHPRITEHARIAGRNHVILFDSDANENPQVLLALTVLARMLTEAGALSVRVALPPSKPSGEKLGIDDYYMEVERRGEAGAEAVQRLLAEAADVDLSYEARWAWKRDMLETEDDKPKKCVANVMNVMAQHPAWEGVIAYDEFREAVVKQRPPPVRAQDGDSAIGEWTEADSTRTAAWFASEIGFEPHSYQVEQAVASVAERTRVHPVRDYLRSIEWDGEGRLDGLFVDYFGATDSPYMRAVATRWMISAVARVMEPGCQADSLVVLEGPQGVGKSRGSRALCGGEWFADTGLVLGDKDSYQCLRAKWIYELSELDSLKGREATRVKAFISSSSDNYRPSFGRRNRDFKRQCVFIGTSNESEYLVDHTGNRRFWPVRCGAKVDIEALRRDRDQLWAEALHRYEQGERWHVDSPELQALFEDEQHEREIGDPWRAKIEPWLTANPRWSAWGVTTADVMDGPLELAPKDQTRAAETRVGQVMRKIGWVTSRPVDKVTGKRTRRYFPPGSAAPDAQTESNRSNQSDRDQPSGEAGWPDKEPATTGTYSRGPSSPTNVSHTYKGEETESSLRGIRTQWTVAGPDGPDGPSAPRRYEIGSVLRTHADVAELVEHLDAHSAELERLASDLPANDNGHAPQRPTAMPALVGDFVAFYRARPEALRRDARQARDARVAREAAQ
jgi:predicted P-loop ATPase